MDPTLLVLGALALSGAAATVAGCAEDLESDVGSQSNPNSQVNWDLRWEISIDTLIRLYQESLYPMVYMLLQQGQ